MKLSPNQTIVLQETISHNGRTAHPNCKTMKALEKKGLVQLVSESLGTWEPTVKALNLFPGI